MEADSESLCDFNLCVCRGTGTRTRTSMCMRVHARTLLSSRLVPLSTKGREFAMVESNQVHLLVYLSTTLSQGTILSLSISNTFTSTPTLHFRGKYCTVQLKFFNSALPVYTYLQAHNAQRIASL